MKLRPINPLELGSPEASIKRAFSIALAQRMNTLPRAVPVAPGVDGRDLDLGVLLAVALALGVAGLGHKNILRFDIAMQDAGGVRRGQAIRNSNEQFDHFAPRTLLDSTPILQRAARTRSEHL